MWSNWWTSARWLLRPTRWNRTVSANSLVNHVDSSMTEHKWHPFRKYSGYIEYQKGQTQARKAITRPERPKPGQKGQKVTNGPFLVMYLCFVFFSLTHAWVSLVVGHPIALNTGIVIIFFKWGSRLISLTLSQSVLCPVLLPRLELGEVWLLDSCMSLWSFLW